MLESAAAASCMPCHDEALNDRSSMPPVSVTMQPRNLPEAAAPLDVDAGVLEPELGALVADPQAARRAAAPTAATNLNVALTQPPRS
jgi:hypothetical protein